MTNLKDKLAGKRIAGIDFGKKRIGLAVCDELHISVNPLTTYFTDKDNYFDELCNRLKKERVEVAVFGVPVTKDGNETEIHKSIKKFAERIISQLNIDIYYIDESYSSINASEFMVNFGIKKKERAKKGTLDRFAAVMILRQFLDDLG